MIKNTGVYRHGPANDEFKILPEAGQDIVPDEQPEDGRDCIKVQSSMLREYTYYYIPADNAYVR